ncbi:MAG: septum formation protein Maf [Atopobiaceae bacterium]|nr:septum formation protein Maf [Atopobiaceae bacterium]
MILASASPRRIDILHQVGLSPTVSPQDVDETPLPDEHPTALVERLSRAKARACVEATATDELVIAADTIVWDEDGDVLGKPADPEEARTMLRTLSGRTHHVSTGVCLLAGDVERSFVETTDVTFLELTDDQIDAYVATGDPLDKAGAYGYQSLGCTLVEGIRGDYYNVVGLPIGRLMRELELLGHQDEGAIHG